MFRRADLVLWSLLRTVFTFELRTLSMREIAEFAFGAGCRLMLCSGSEGSLTRRLIEKSDDRLPIAELIRYRRRDLFQQGAPNGRAEL